MCEQEEEQKEREKEREISPADSVLSAERDTGFSPITPRS